jgi:hypothetical protein
MEVTVTTEDSRSDAIGYSAISEAARELEKSKSHRVLLSRAQAEYFRRHLMMMCGMRRRASNTPRFEGIRFHILQLTILLRFPRLLELAYFYDIDDATTERVRFEEVAEGTMVTFLPK